MAAEVKAARDQGLARYRQVMNSDETPINPYRVYGDLMEVLDLKNSFVTHESGNTRDQLSTVFDTLIPRGFLGWGNVSTLGFSLAAAIAAKKAFPDRASVAVTGEAGLGYMLGNLEVLLREKLGVTVVHITNGGFAGYGPGFWGAGTRSLHPPGAGARRGGYVEGDRRPRLPHRAGQRAGRNHPGPAPRARNQ